MEVPNRDKLERELAAVLLILWIAFDSSRGRMGFEKFLKLFNDQARPIYSRVYGTARTNIVSSFGMQYQEVERPDGTVEIKQPGHEAQINRWAKDLYESFKARRQDWQKRRDAAKRDPDQDLDEVRPGMTDQEAEAKAVTSITEVHSQGEVDGSDDFKKETGVAIRGMWVTELDPCKDCRRLNGTFDLWRKVYPNGPPAHPNCRCHLEWTVDPSVSKEFLRNFYAERFAMLTGTQSTATLLPRIDSDYMPSKKMIEQARRKRGS